MTTLKKNEKNNFAHQFSALLQPWRFCNRTLITAASSAILVSFSCVLLPSPVNFGLCALLQCVFLLLCVSWSQVTCHFRRYSFLVFVSFSFLLNHLNVCFWPGPAFNTLWPLGVFHRCIKRRGRSTGNFSEEKPTAHQITNPEKWSYHLKIDWLVASYWLYLDPFFFHQIPIFLNMWQHFLIHWNNYKLALTPLT